jgi:hypothetical protein
MSLARAKLQRSIIYGLFMVQASPMIITYVRHLQLEYVFSEGH